MASLRGQNVAVPLRTPNTSDVWIQYSARGRTRSNAIARLRPEPEPRKRYPELSYLAHAVIAQACKDAAPHKSPKMNDHNLEKMSKDRLKLQCQALLWLCSDDPDLEYWADLAEYSIHSLHHEYLPVLERFCHEHTRIALAFSLPRWALEWCLPPRMSA
jgi:hypothetical protein